jgi:outer membrane protein assembly factor BamB
LGKKSVIFTGSAHGGFYSIEVDKDAMPYSMTLTNIDAAAGPSESPPKRAADGTLYVADLHGQITSYHYDFAAGHLALLSTYSLGEPVSGAIALYDLDPVAPGEEVLVATREGGFYVLDHSLSVKLWSETTGHDYADEYYAGVTVAQRDAAAPIALLPIADRASSPPSPNSGLLRAINLDTGEIEWELHPSLTTLGDHEIPGSVSLMHPFTSSGEATTGGAGLDPTSDLATFASTDGHLYAVDLASGLEVWAYAMSAAGFDAPVTDRHNVVYVGDGASILHALYGPTGEPFWTNSMLSDGGSEDVVKLGLSYYKELLAASRNFAYVLLP